jgi:hypothetical protein
MNAKAPAVRDVGSLSIDDWNECDPEGFSNAAVKAAEDDFETIATELACDPGAGAFWRGQIRERLRKMLDAEVAENRPWVVAWESRFTCED